MSIWLWLIIAFVVLIGATVLIGHRRFAKNQLRKLWDGVVYLIRGKGNAN